MNQFYKNLALWLVISLVMILLFNMMTQKSPDQEQVSYSTFLNALEKNQVVEVTIQGSDLEGKLKDNTLFKTYVPDDPGLVKELRSKGVAIKAKPQEDRGFWVTMLASWGPILLLIAVWIFFMRQMQSGGGKAMSFGKSKSMVEFWSPAISCSAER